jgi:Flp pilus assembly protein TadG
MRRALKDRRGSAALLYFGLTFLLLTLTFLIIETGSTLENYSYAESALQRCCNSAVEANIDDSWRADHILKLDTAGAQADLMRFVREDLPEKYVFTLDSVQCAESPPSMTVTGTIRFGTVFGQYGFGSVTHSVKVVSTNYALDGR